MSGLKKRFIFDAGVKNDPKMNLPELNDQGGHGSVDVPRSSYKIVETVDLAFTNKIVQSFGKRLSFADGDVRPGTTK